MQIRLNFVTPLWTADASKAVHRVQVTGLLGSLRWWYEALVRGLGGYVGDPTAEQKQYRCEFDSKAYQEMLHNGKSTAEALTEGLKSLGAVEYLFGATGWARLFGVQGVQAERTPLHFRTTLDINKNWLVRVFQGAQEKPEALEGLEVPYGAATLHLFLRGPDAEYVQSQLALLFQFVASYGGLGARLQHGFGQITDLTLPPEMAHISFETGLQLLKAKLGEAGGLRQQGDSRPTPYDLRNFFHLTYQLPPNALARFMHPHAHLGSARKKAEDNYLPCAFDLRYKGELPLGLRRWLRDEKGWPESDDPKRLGRLDKLMGPRSQWKNARRQSVTIADELRTAGRIYFGMPVKVGEGYQLVIFGFAPPEEIHVTELCALCEEYMQGVFAASPGKRTFGQDLLKLAPGGA